MEIYLIFLITCVVLGLVRPEARPSQMLWAVIGMSILLSIGYFVFRLV